MIDLVAAEDNDVLETAKVGLSDRLSPQGYSVSLSARTDPNRGTFREPLPTSKLSLSKWWRVGTQCSFTPATCIFAWYLPQKYAPNMTNCAVAVAQPLFSPRPRRMAPTHSTRRG